MSVWQTPHASRRTSDLAGFRLGEVDLGDVQRRGELLEHGGTDPQLALLSDRWPGNVIDGPRTAVQRWSEEGAAGRWGRPAGRPHWDHTSSSASRA